MQIKKIRISAPAGIFTIDQLAGVSQLAKDCGAVAAKLTVRESMLFILPEENFPAFVEGIKKLDLLFPASPVPGIVRFVRSCGGGRPYFCDKFLANAYELTKDITGAIVNRTELPDKFKIAVSGCQNGCSNPCFADFGAMGAGKDVFDVYIGGRGGSASQVKGVLVARKVPKEKIIPIIEHVLGQYKELALQNERIVKTIGRVGLARFCPPATLLK